MTEEQLNALAAFINTEPHTLLYGGASGGKTVVPQEPEADKE